MDFINNDKTLVILKSFSKQCGACDIVGKLVGFEKVDYGGLGKMIGNPVTFADLSGSPKKSRATGGESHIQQSADYLTHEGILSG